MSKLLPSLLTLSGLLLVQAQAGVFQCPGPDGSIIFSDTACELQDIKKALNAAPEKKSQSKPKVVAQKANPVQTVAQKPNQACHQAQKDLVNAKEYLESVKTDVGKSYAQGLFDRARDRYDRKCVQ